MYGKNRRVQITSLEQREKVEHMYICLELFNRICFPWIRFSWPLIIFSLSLGVIITAFVSIRFTSIPIYLYMIFPTTATILMAIMFWNLYDLLIVIRDSEDIMRQLWSYEAPYLRPMPNNLRTRVLKRAKAMRVLEFPVGEFADFNINLPIAMWDEILNQVLFLLSL